MRLKDRVALVTGGASGIGRALAAALGREGARVGLLDRNAEALDAVRAELQAAGVPCAQTVADVRDRSTLGTAVAVLTEALGPIDVLIACAGITGVTLLDELDSAATEAIVQVNLLGTIYTMDAVLPGMLARGQGHIVGVSSLAGMCGLPFSAAYCASKAGLAVYLDSLRPALRRRGIAVTTIFPGFVRTPLMKAARIQPPVPMMEPDEAARRILKAILKRHRLYGFPWSVRMPLQVIRWLPTSWFDWLMAHWAGKFPDVKY